ncbi:hypothetical protein G6F61_014945 [Rhizopus arrhizus]|nr:hypothetical protein G6F61_014945 [Rhizopus arrhizus]
MPTRSTQRPARTENNIGSTANTATSVPTLKVDRPICSAVSETVIRPPVRDVIHHCQQAQQHRPGIFRGTGRRGGGSVGGRHGVTAFILGGSSVYVEARVFCTAANCFSAW